MVRLDLPTHHRRTADRPADAGPRDRGRPRRGAGRGTPGGVAGPAQPRDGPARVVAQMVNYRSHAVDSGIDPDTRAAGVLPQGLTTRSPARPATSSGPPAWGSSTTRSNSAWSSAGDLPVGTTVTEEDLSGYVAGLGSRQRRQRPADPADPHPVLRGQVLPDLHPGRAVADPGRRGRPEPPRPRCGSRCRSTAQVTPGQHGRRHDRAPGAGVDPAVPVPAAGSRRPAADRHPRRHRADRPAEGRSRSSPRCCPRPRSGGCSSDARPATPGTCTTATSSPPPSPPPTARWTSVPSAPALSGSRS